jgi:hypothetical protein
MTYAKTGRPRHKKSKRSFMNLGLTAKEDAQLITVIKGEDSSGRQFLRKLVREHLETLK